MYKVSQNIDPSLKVDTLSKRRDEDKLPSHPIENPRANYHEQAKADITLKNGKLVDNKVGEPIKDGKLNENETEGIDKGTKIERKIEKHLASSNSKILESSPIKAMKCLFCRIIRQHIVEATEMVYYFSEHALILLPLPGCVALFFCLFSTLGILLSHCGQCMVMDLCSISVITLA
ncbi:hypothetical protein M9H77_32139 [Catharanthus roseus]|uniref:Uncharacterized protein n=1 Tax=Catharanthus roseus TaxID=4058 RepID=A0ACC0A3C3_CATRO|nr:hypothetical protein M9H77_32139 [Catharanthus roseus]